VNVPSESGESMREAEFDAWLKNDYAGRSGGLSEHDRAPRLWLARRIEQFEGDLDTHYADDGMAKLLERLAYAYADSVRGQGPHHSIPIERNAYKMTANFRHAASLYLKFRRGAKAQFPSDPVTPRPGLGRVAGQRDWPEWEQPSRSGGTGRSIARACGGNGNTRTLHEHHQCCLRASRLSPSH
jgi:hypothetical protein